MAGTLTFAKWRSTSASDNLRAATIRERQLQALASFVTQTAPS